VFIGDDLSARLVHTNAPDNFGDAQAIKHWQVEGQQRLADVETRKQIFFQHDDALAFLGKQRRNSEPGGTTADSEDIAFLEHLSDRAPNLIQRQ
jgi:hypothetical protein